MDRGHWERVQALFHDVVDLPPAERATRLDSCHEPQLVDQVLALIEEDRLAVAPDARDVARIVPNCLGDDSAVFAGMDFGPYRAGTLLGEGGMGVVYLAERRDLGSQAAIKVLRNAWLSPARRERFAAEQRTLANLAHPSIARLLDADSLPDGTPWFAMEYVRGVSITDYCAAHETSIEGRLELFRAVCEAVQYAHGKALIHRDLKPSNILVEADGAVKLLDFGIAKHLADMDAEVDQTRTGLRLMTPAYAAPEQLRGEPVGIQADVYSLGVILYELLTLRLPFDPACRTPGALLALTDPERPSAVAGPAGPKSRAGGRTEWPDIDVLCLTAMHSDPLRRYSTVEALIRDIGHYLSGEPLEARPDALAYRMGKFVRRNRASVLAGALVLLVVAGLVAFYTWSLAGARDEAEANAARTARVQQFMLSLFAGGDESVGPAEDLRVVTLLQRGVDEADALARDPLVQSELYRTLGGIYQKLGEFERADELLGRALEIALGHLGGDDPEVANARVAVGELRLDQARYDEAEQATREGLAILRRHRDPAAPSVLHGMAVLGQILEARGEYAQAIATNEAVVRLLERGGDTAALTEALGRLAGSHFYAGDLDRADELNRRVLELTRMRYGERHPRVADVLINLGASRVNRGEYADAEELFRQAMDVLVAYHGRDHYQVASCMTMLGRALVYQREFAEGKVLLAEALEIQERVNGPIHPRVASALNDLGSAALQEGRLDEAEERFSRMLAIYREVYTGDHYLIGTATSNLASVLTAKHEHAGAEALYREAIEIFERTLSPTDLNTGIGRIKLGRVLLRQGRFAEAEAETRGGYEIVAAQASPSVSWLKSARTDLVAEYEGLDRPERAAEYRD